MHILLSKKSMTTFIRSRKCYITLSVFKYVVRIFTMWCYLCILFLCHNLHFFVTVNMAMHRQTFQLNTLSKYPSSRLVDGKKSNLHLNGDQCSSTTDYQCNAMWRVDLENIRRIERIVVYSRTDNLEWGKEKVNVKLQLCKQTPVVNVAINIFFFNPLYMFLKYSPLSTPPSSKKFEYSNNTVAKKKLQSVKR